jgi:hypothetical protein
MTILRGSREYKFLQTIRVTAVVLALINIYLYTHQTVYKYFDSDYLSAPYYKVLAHANVYLGMFGLLYYAVVDSTSSVLMAS